MLVIETNSASEAFVAAARAVLERGSIATPRGLVTREVLGAQIVIKEPVRRLVSAAGRRLNPCFAGAEACWILAGSDEGWIYDFNKKLAVYADEGVLLGAYGPRIRRWHKSIDQLDRTRRLLLRDPDSRQATLQIFDPARDAAPNRDVPCTLNHRFYLRNGRLHMHTTMRSQDVWLGMPYDLFAATMLLEVMAGFLNADVGHYVLSIDSLHLYEQDWVSAAKVEVRELDGVGPPLGTLAVAWEDFDRVLVSTIKGVPSHVAGWDQLALSFDAHRLWRRGETNRSIEMTCGKNGSYLAAVHRWFCETAERRARA